MIKVTNDNIIELLNNLPIVIGRYFEHNNIFISGRLHIERVPNKWSINYRDYENNYIFDNKRFDSFDDALKYIIDMLYNSNIEYKIIV